jgi:hypothetical protein
MMRDKEQILALDRTGFEKRYLEERPTIQA